ncbi:carbon monoxide dehydrogenase [Mycolicibacterium agri]|uniref:Carbon monoxide dehydrogenase n=1 Tax=Mycolicibacterium agri TaxID=36811 RepID=A0A2A7NH12_MYCAG|nr:xanthine dehydrogenase family protein subunit M [Mycolicibacterium agri]PEG42721.1 carbon monoxide dehydrogenase [Mycolicibacterium agri]GFG52708.1 carbon-monoxide dehydrogenase medium subunit [Mycolicibacterium agri]
MIPSNFDYVAPATVSEAVAALAQGGEDAKVIAGGQTLMPVLRLRLAAPSVLVDLGKIEELRGVREDGDSLVIGAMTTYYALLRNSLISKHALLLAEATRTVADPQIRHRGTLGGNLAHADPAGDLAAPVLALDATMTIVGPSGARTVPASEFFVDYFTTALGPEEILTEIRIPKHTDWPAHYEKMHRVAQAWSIVAVAATVEVDQGTVAQARIALTNVAPTPTRARAVEEALIGQPASDELIRTAAEHAAEGIDPISDGNADAEYRSHLARVLTRRAVATAAGV